MSRDVEQTGPGEVNDPVRNRPQGETRKATVDARAGGRQKMNFQVLVISLLLALLGFGVAWFLSNMLA
jgi:hypothetical protein